MAKSSKAIYFDSQYPSVESLRQKAKRSIPNFAFDYLDGGCNEDVNLHKNTLEIKDVELVPSYLHAHKETNMRTELFGHVYDAPFGMSPVGFQGLMWPNSPEILAKAAFEHNIPFILSNVTTSSIERISELTEGRAWFQLYHPAENSIRDDILKRAEIAGCQVLVLICDVPTRGFRPRDIKNGLAMPPKMSAKNILQIIGKPEWALRTLIHGRPNFETLKPYMPKKRLSLKQLGQFMGQTSAGRLNEDKIRAIRDLWQGKLILKGVTSEVDVEKAIQLGMDGIIVSNHGGRQLDAGESSIKSLMRITASYEGKIKIMMDSGLRSGPDIARALASGAEFTFMGRAFMYGVSALGTKGGDHTISMFKTQLQQVMEQLGCENIEQLPSRLVSKSKKSGLA
ncbi:MAG: alpha-hydroxy-acid oxidizing enzyme [Maribacter sp.]|nr:MAG: alpha-hydroxy-acid oxidizing enzyme [Maribacter sp.]